MKPDQSNNSTFEALDNYFKKGADRVPVDFDPAHWEHLSAMLDKVKTPLQPSAPPRGSGRWLLPVLLVAALATAFVAGGYIALATVRPDEKALPDAGVTLQRETAQPAAPADLPAAPESAAADSPVKNRAAPTPSAPGSGPLPAAQPAQEPVVVPNTSMPSDTAATLRASEPAAAPSAAPAPKAKKKKNLFW